jgi:prepilin-type N-terminal cleavage/methylation domain-containing protein
MRASRHRKGLTLAEVIAALAVLAVFALAVAPLMNIRPTGRSTSAAVKETSSAAFRKAHAEGAPSLLRIRDGKFEAVDADANIIGSVDAPKGATFILATARASAFPGEARPSFELVNSMLIRPDEGGLPFRVELKGAGDASFVQNFDALSGEPDAGR